jgi:hypothetical protein
LHRASLRGERRRLVATDELSAEDFLDDFFGRIAIRDGNLNSVNV